MFDFNIGLSETADPNVLYDVVIIGGGPAGLTAGMYCARYKLTTLLIEQKAVIGGQLTATEWVENYPGFPEPVLGAKLAKDMEFQAKTFGMKVINEPVIAVDFKDKVKYIHTPYANWKAKAVLIATGTSSRKLGALGEDDFYGKGVSYCATCDGPFYQDKVIASVGGGNSAFEESLFLAKYASKVYLIHRSNRYRADKILIDRVIEHPKIVLMPFYQVLQIDFINPEDKKILIKNLQSEEESHLKVDGIFIFIGNEPNSTLFKDILETSNGFILTNNKHQTSIKGVWAAGDVTVKNLRQVATAVGDGAEAAYYINKYLEEWKQE